MVGETAGVNQTHSPHGASALPSYAPSGCMDQPTQAQARLAMLIMPYHVPDFPCTLPRWLLPAAGRDGLGLVDGLLHRLHHPDSQQRGKATGALPSSPAGVPRRQGSRRDGGCAGAAARADTGRRRRLRKRRRAIISNAGPAPLCYKLALCPLQGNGRVYFVFKDMGP